MLSLRTFSGRRYRVAGQLPSPLGDDFHRRLTDRRFLPLTASEESTFGWVTADNLLLTQFDIDTVIRGEHAALALRIDRRKVNPRLLRAQMDLEFRGRQKAAEDAGRTWRMTRDERVQIRAELHEQMLRETNPSVAVCAMLLHPKRRTLYVFSLARTVNELVIKLFRDTFGADLIPLTPWHRAGEILAGTEAEQRLSGLPRTDFAAAPGSGALTPHLLETEAAPDLERRAATETVLHDVDGVTR